MARSLAITLLVTICFSSGCAKYWYQEGKTIGECKQDRRMCFEGLKKYSPNWQDMGEYEFKFMEDCMKQKGYQLVTEKKLPLKVQREDPDRWQHFRLKGAVGTLDEER